MWLSVYRTGTSPVPTLHEFRIHCCETDVVGTTLLPTVRQVWLSVYLTGTSPVPTLHKKVKRDGSSYCHPFICSLSNRQNSFCRSKVACRELGEVNTCVGWTPANIIEPCVLSLVNDRAYKSAR